ncbi:flippase [Acidithiobacillus sp.]|uniref:flippase n=1 Tax=Acidithiobacillus sp. TaxID=1872118 RepID=UPI00261D6E61|nr:flippase [Acidithiobacillus sp.]MDD2748533.1 flippase [Acidithiobacillus sp.]MDD5279320.1 flippase [Acidithiobacillus sp.]
MSDRKRLLGNMASLFTLQGANYLLPLVTLPYLVRVLGPEKFGLIAFSQAFIQYFVVATDYGFNLSATREIAVHRDNPEKLGEIVSAVLTIKIALFLAGALILAALVATIPTFHVHWALYLIVYLTVMGATLFPTWLFQGLERMKDITWMNMGARLITTACIFIFVQNTHDYLIAAGIQSVPVLLAAIPAWLVLRRKQGISWRIPSRESLRIQLNNGWHVFLSTAAINVYTSSNAFVLGLIAGPVAVGYFSAANKIVQAVQGMLTPVTQTLYPHISTLAAQSHEAALAFIRRILPYIAVVGLVFSSGLFVAAAPIVHLVLGDQYDASIPILQWLALLPFIIALSNVYGIQTMLTLGMNQIFSRILIASAALNALLIFPLAWRYAGMGAAMSMLITEMFVTVTMAVVLHKRGINVYRSVAGAL